MKLFSRSLVAAVMATTMVAGLAPLLSAQTNDDVQINTTVETEDTNSTSVEESITGDAAQVADVIRNIISGDNCSWVNTNLRPGQVNPRLEVVKLQAFLRFFEDLPVQTTGIYDAATVAAVNTYQTRYASEILVPWGYSEPTGVTYILTRKKINETFCEKSFPLTTAQQQEVIAFRLSQQAGVTTGTVTPTTTTTPVPSTNNESNDVVTDDDDMVDDDTDEDENSDPTSDEDDEIGTDEDGDGDELDEELGDEADSFAAALTTFPTGAELARCVFYFLIMLAVIYVVTSIIVGTSEEDDLVDVKELRRRKIFYFIIGSIFAVIVSFLLNLFCLVLPFIVLIVVLALVLLFSGSSDEDDEHTPTPSTTV